MQSTISHTPEAELEFTPVVLIVFNDSRDVNIKKEPLRSERQRSAARPPLLRFLALLWQRCRKRSGRVETGSGGGRNKGMRRALMPGTPLSENKKYFSR